MKLIKKASYIILLVIIIFLQTKYLFGADSAEYSVSLSSFSIPHPPGYPLYSFIGNIITRIIPIYSISWRAALLSSIPTVITSYIIYKILSLKTKNSLLSYFASLFYVFLFPIWLYAEVPEVFALNNLFIALITYLLIKNNIKCKNIYQYLVFFILGLCISHHHTFVLFIPGWYLLIKKNIKNQFFKKNIVKKISLILVGCSFYIYAPIASFFNPPIDWENAKTIEGFIRLITRSSYGTFNAYSNSIPNIGNQLFDAFSLFIFILHDFKVLGLIFLIFGVIYLVKNKNNFSIFLLITLLIHVFFLFYTNFILRSVFTLAIFERYLIFVYLNLIFIFTYGILFFLKFLNKIKNKYIYNKVIKNVFTYSAYIFLLLYLSICFYNNFKVISKLNTSSYFENYAKDVLNSVPKNSILFTKSDTPYFTTEYMYSIEKVRPDIKLIYIPLLTRDYYRNKIKIKYPEVFIPNFDIDTSKFYKSFLIENNKKMQIFFEAPYNEGNWLPYGLVWKYYPSKELAKEDTNNVIKVNNKLWNKYRIPNISDKLKNILFLFNVKELYSRQISKHIELLIINKQFDDALNLSDKYKYLLERDDYIVKKTKIYLLKKDCKNISAYITQIKKYEIFRQSEKELKMLLMYYAECDNKNPEIYQYIKLYQNYKKEL